MQDRGRVLQLAVLADGRGLAVALRRPAPAMPSAATARSVSSCPSSSPIVDQVRQVLDVAAREGIAR